MLRDDALDFHSMVSNELNLHPENDERTSLDNSGPDDYKSTALPTELYRLIHICSYKLINI